MKSNDELLREINSTLGNTVYPSHTPHTATSDVFEAYAFAIIVEAARREGANVTFLNVDGSPATPVFIFRTSPSYVHTETQNYSYALIEFPGKPPLEAHVGIYVEGKSKLMHECDVAVLTSSEAYMCRRHHVLPRSSKVKLAVECKFYAGAVPLGLARSFLGLGLDLSTKNHYFVVNNESANASELLKQKKKEYFRWIVPANTLVVDRLRNAFQTAFDRL